MPRPSSGAGLSLAELQSIIESRNAELKRLKKRRNTLQRRLDDLDKKIQRIEGAGRGGTGRSHNATSLPDTIDQVLRRHGKPMKVGDIVSAVEATGYRSSSDNFRGIVNQSLIKDERFAAPERGLYQ